MTDDDDDDGPPMPTQAELEASLERSRADVAAGRTVPGEVVLARLRERLRRYEAEQPRKVPAPAKH